MTDEVAPTPRVSGALPRFRNLRRLAARDAAFLYRAFDVTLGRDVALKVLAPEFSQDAARVERFALEARRVRALRHPHIAPLLDAGAYRERVFLTMPLYPTSLDNMLREYGPLGWTQAHSIVSQVATALEYAHGQGIIHRNVKPSNILLDEDYNPYLTDFAIAKPAPSAPVYLGTSGPLLDEDASAGPPLWATPEYSAPELLLGRPVDARADVYALCVALYELLTGQTPCAPSGPNMGATGKRRAYLTLVRALTETPTAPSIISPRPLPDGLDAALLRGLHRDPQQRYASVRELRLTLATLR